MLIHNDNQQEKLENSNLEAISSKLSFKTKFQKELSKQTQ